MAYPMPLFYQEQDTVTRDLEYLQEMYPTEAKKYQKVIAEILDRLDYEGSMIYDEYPDKWQIYRLTQVVLDKLKQAENAEMPQSEQDWDRTTELVRGLVLGLLKTPYESKRDFKVLTGELKLHEESDNKRRSAWMHFCAGAVGLKQGDESGKYGYDD